MDNFAAHQFHQFFSSVFSMVNSAVHQFFSSVFRSAWRHIVSNLSSNPNTSPWDLCQHRVGDRKLWVNWRRRPCIRVSGRTSLRWRTWISWLQVMCEISWGGGFLLTNLSVQTRLLHKHPVRKGICYRSRSQPRKGQVRLQTPDHKNPTPHYFVVW